MIDPVLASCSIALGVAFFLSADCIRRWTSLEGGIPSLCDRIHGRHERLAILVFAGKRGDVAGAPLADHGRALLSGEAAALALLALSLSIFGTPALSLLPLLPAAAFLAGRASLASEGKKALAEIRRDLPGAALLLSLLLDSGLSVGSALPEVLSSVEGSRLARELSAIRSARAMGKPPQEAYRDAMERGRDEDYHAFLSILQQGERVGTGLSRSLSDLSARMLDSEVNQAESRAQKAPVRLLAPLVLCFFPSVAILILSPVILSLLSGEVLP
jgi:tight adherence protein C